MSESTDQGVPHADVPEASGSERSQSQTTEFTSTETPATTASSNENCQETTDTAASSEAAQSTNLTTLAEKTKSSLQAIWDELGVDQNERDHKLRQLHAEVESLYKNTVDEQTKRKEKVKEDIDCEIHATEAISKKLKEDARIPERGNKTLLEYHRSIKDRQSELDKKIAERHEKLQELYQTLSSLCSELGEEMSDAFKTIGEVYSQERIDQFQQCISAKESEKRTRENSKSRHISKIKELWEEMEMEPEGAFQQQIMSSPEELPLRQPMLEQLAELQQELENEKSRREERLKDLGDSITDLWAKLDTPQEEKDRFFENHHGIGNKVLDGCQSYLNNLREEFQSKMGEIIQGYREKIQSLWDSLLYSEEQGKEEFPSIEEEEYDENLLNEHEQYIQTLEEKLQELTPILKGIEKRDALLEDKKEYERIISDPNRLLSRGGGTARLKEEKLEKRVRKELPAVTKRVAERISEWERQNEKSFYIRGKRYLDEIEEETSEEEKRATSKRTSTVAKGGQNKAQRSRTLGATASSSTRQRSRSKTPSGSTSATLGKSQSRRAPLAPSSANTSVESTETTTPAPSKSRGQNSRTGTEQPASDSREPTMKLSNSKENNNSSSGMRISSAARSSASKMLEAMDQ
eukprot:gb/GECG01005843.1/.p1 GENE.gb/GECG01005843.1/~~gb/GECG01005843.1/.p1  ORF type:complete len:636 (+),score=135.93 gb/GECG01005843.1/:1-1908(+)